VLYPQNGDRIVTIDTVTSLHPMFRSTQPCIPPGSLNRVPASAGVRRECHLCRVAVTLCDPMWHVSSRSGVATLRTAIHLLLLLLLYILALEMVSPGNQHCAYCIGTLEFPIRSRWSRTRSDSECRTETQSGIATAASTVAY